MGAVLNAASGVCFNLMSSGVNLQEGGRDGHKEFRLYKGVTTHWTFCYRLHLWTYIQAYIVWFDI